MVLIFIGVAGSAFDTDKKADLKKGEGISIRGYDIKLAGIDEGKTPNYEWLSAKLEVSRKGKPIGTFAPEKHFYMASQQPTSEVRRYSTFQGDLYLVFSAFSEDGKATIQAFVKPLVRWVWLGGIVVFLGTGITMVPAKRELKLARQADQARARKAGGDEGKSKYEVA
jgi:cytochrome c-type biogenesis protein CcmF